MSERINKARYWWAVLWVDNLIEDWVDKLPDLVQLPYAGCEHSKDTDIKSENRKNHIHLILVFPNTTTYKHALSVFKQLGENAVNTCEAIINIRHAYDYLIHDTENCRKQGKYLYDAADRFEGNNFDIGFYEQISEQQKNEMLEELCNYLIDYKIQNMADAFILISQNFSADYFPIVKANNAFLDRITRGNYLKYSDKKEDEK